MNQSTLNQLLEGLKEHYLRVRTDASNREYDNNDLDAFKSIVERLVELVPVLEPYFEDVNGDTNSWMYICGGFATHEMVEIYANKIMAVWDNMEFIQQHNKINRRLKKILNVSCYVEDPDIVESDSSEDEGDDDDSTDYSGEFGEDDDDESVVSDDNEERTVESYLSCKR